MTPPLLEIADLRVEGKGEDGRPIPVVRGVSFEVARGKVVALIGESGSGKTTIGLSALGYAKPGLHFAGGAVRLHGKDVLRMDAPALRRLRGGRVAYVAQSAAAAFNPSLRIGQQVTEPAVLHGLMSQEEADARAAQLYRALELPDPDGIGRRYPHQVSGGQLQRLMAAMALVGRPDLLVLDEPTTALDVTTQIEVLGAFKRVIREEGAAAIFIAHDLAVVAQVADEIVVLHGGLVMERGTAEQVITHPAHDYTRRLMEAVRPPPGAAALGIAPPKPPEAIPALQAVGVSAGYGGRGGPVRKVLFDVEVTVERGHAVGVIGESGCGKSTLARVMAGLTPASGGTILLEGHALAPAVPQRRREELRKVQMVFQMADTALNPRQRIGEIIGRPVELFLGLKGDARHRKVAELLHLVELPADFAERYPAELSGGQKQRINLARALAAEPEVLLCDEVTSALDTIVGSTVMALLKELRRKMGVSFIFISHDLSTVASFADEIVVLYAGHVVEKGPAAAVLAPPFHPYTRLLIASVPELRVGWLEEMLATRTAKAGIARVVGGSAAAGCPFFDRCPLAIPGTCDRQPAPRREAGPGHVIACHRSAAELAEPLVEAPPPKLSPAGWGSAGATG